MTIIDKLNLGNDRSLAVHHVKNAKKKRLKSYHRGISLLIYFA